jgi:hypothetical protein
MKKNILKIAILFLYAGFSNNTFAQTTATTIPLGFITKTIPATSANVLKWTKEVLPKMELLVPKLEKIKADNEGKKASMDGISYLVAVTQMKAIVAKGTRLTAAEAKKYCELFAATVNRFYIECKSQSGNICCVECHNNVILGVWCFANCFVARFPGLD